jgi:hypothetical protein
MPKSARGTKIRHPERSAQRGVEGPREIYSCTTAMHPSAIHRVPSPDFAELLPAISAPKARNSSLSRHHTKDQRPDDIPAWAAGPGKRPDSKTEGCKPDT